MGDMNKVLVLDLETTDLRPQLGEIIEIGAVLLSADGTIEKVIDTVVKPTKPTKLWRDCWCLRNTSLTVKAVLAGQSLSGVRCSLQKLLREYPVTSYNRDFDIKYLTYNGFKIYQKVACPMVLAADILKLPGYRGDYKWPKFQEAWDYFFPCESYGILHRALDDAWHVARLIHRLEELGCYALGSE